MIRSFTCKGLWIATVVGNWNQGQKLYLQPQRASSIRNQAKRYVLSVCLSISSALPTHNKQLSSQTTAEQQSCLIQDPVHTRPSPAIMLKTQA